VSSFRSIEAAIQRLLIDERGYMSLKARGVEEISDLAAFFYVVFFRVLRKMLEPFSTSNPTWIKQPRSRQSRLRPDQNAVYGTFKAEAENLASVNQPKASARGKGILGVASSESLPLPDASIDLVLSSPPYCTRIDYAVATSIELAALGYSLDHDLENLRRALIGNTTVPKLAAKPSAEWGATCLEFLDKLSKHSAKASSTYYYKNHLQYFESVSQSLSEISRVLKPNGRCVLVIQDSYYKDLYNNLSQAFAEMAGERGLETSERFDFPLSRTMAGINPRAGRYRSTFSAVESVLVLGKSQGSRA
jgi:SAM-dependent methyltransferase